MTVHDNKASSPRPNDMPFSTVLAAVWKRRLQVLAFVIAAAVPVYFLNDKLAPVYEAETTLVIRSGSEHLDAAEMLRGSLQRSFLLDLVEEIRSRSVAQRVLESLPEAERDALAACGRGRTGADVDPVHRVRRAVHPELVRESDVIRVKAEACQPELAAILANAVAKVLGERNLDSKRAELAGLRQFIETQIDTLASSLRESEEELNGFKKERGVVALEKEAESVLDRITSVESELQLASTELTSKRRENQALLQELERQKLDLPNSGAELASPYVAELKRNLVELQVRNTRLQVEGYASDHPEMLRLAREIHSVRERIGLELNRIPSEGSLLDPMRSIPAILQRQIDLQIDIHALDARVRALRSVRDAYENEMLQFPERELALMRLTRRNMLNEKVYMMLLEKREEARIAEAARIGNVRVLDPAIVPEAPIRPRKTLNLCIAVLFGLAVGMTFALQRHAAERVVCTPGEMRAANPLPLLGSVPLLSRPRVRRVRRGDVAFPLLLRGSRVHPLPSTSPEGEAYRCLRTNLGHLGEAGLPSRILVTSPGPREGKSTTALNLAIGLALTGIDTCLLDADMRRPSLHRAMGGALGPGLADWLETRDRSSPVEQVTPYSHLALVSAGTSKVNPAELLGSAGTKTLLERLALRHRVVVVESPPVVPVTDQALLAEHVDVVLLVVLAGRTHLESIDRAEETLRAVGVRTIHLVLNGVKRADYYGKYTSYYKSYTSSRSKAIA